MRIAVYVLSLPILLFSACAQAANVQFSANVTGLCSVSLGLNGTMGLSGDGTILGAEEGGLGGTVLILSIGTSTIDVSAPARISPAPPGYDDSLEVVEVRYSGLNGLSTISQNYTDQPTSFQAANIPLTVLNVFNRIVNPNGFTTGNYVTQTVITCS